MTVKPAQDNILESWRIYNQIMFSKAPIETKIEVLEQRLAKEEIDKVLKMIDQVHKKTVQMNLFEFLNQFPQQE